MISLDTCCVQLHHCWGDVSAISRDFAWGTESACGQTLARTVRQRATPKQTSRSSRHREKVLGAHVQLNGERDVEFDMFSGLVDLSLQSPALAGARKGVGKVRAVHTAVFPPLAWRSGMRYWSLAELQTMGDVVALGSAQSQARRAGPRTFLHTNCGMEGRLVAQDVERCLVDQQRPTTEQLESGHHSLGKIWWTAGREEHWQAVVADRARWAELEKDFIKRWFVKP